MDNLYLGKKIKLIKKRAITEDSNLYTFKFPKPNFKLAKKFKFKPGQFIILSIPGAGEAPFAPCSNPFKTKTIDLMIRQIGLVTTALNNIKPGTWLEYRGPYGNGFPLKEFKGKNIILIVGGTAIAPIAALIEYLSENRRRYKKNHLLYGAKNQENLLFKDKYKKWSKKIKLHLCVEEKTAGWKDDIGFVSDLCYKIEDIEPKKTIVIMCGPPAMYKPVIDELKDLKIKPEQIYVSLESRMKCGIGKCQHCAVGKKYTCLDGPIFRYSNIIKDLEIEN